MNAIAPLVIIIVCVLLLGIGLVLWNGERKLKVASEKNAALMAENERLRELVDKYAKMIRKQDRRAVAVDDWRN